LSPESSTSTCWTWNLASVREKYWSRCGTLTRANEFKFDYNIKEELLRIN
jgi:hypothetical protein